MATVSTQRKGMSFELDVLSAAKRYNDVAAYRPSLTVALKNNGFSPRPLCPLIIKEDSTLRFKRA